LVEGNSIRSTERMTDTHRDTIMRLMVEVGTGCASLANDQMRNLDCRRIQCDEIWTFCRMKQARIPRFTDRTKVGDQWTLVAIDPDTKLIPAYRVGKRTRDNAVAFMTDLSERLSNRIQISSDSLRSYVDAVERAFGADVDYGQIVKFYDAEPIGPGRYAPPRVTGEPHDQERVWPSSSAASALGRGADRMRQIAFRRRSDRPWLRNPGA
jgi:hypothetical protein